MIESTGTTIDTRMMIDTWRISNWMY